MAIHIYMCIYDANQRSKMAKKKHDLKFEFFKQVNVNIRCYCTLLITSEENHSQVGKLSELQDYHFIILTSYCQRMLVITQ